MVVKPTSVTLKDHIDLNSLSRNELIELVHSMRQERDFMQNLADRAEEAMAIHQQGNLIAVNAAAARLYGRNQEAMIGMHIRDFCTEETMAIAMKYIAVESEEPYDGIGVKADGSHFPARFQGKKVEHQGKAYRVVLVRDLTVQKRADQELRNNEERYRTIFESVGVAIGEFSFQPLKKHRDLLKAEGVINFRRYLLENHGIFQDLSRHMVPVDFNDENLRLFEAKDKSELLSRTNDLIVPETVPYLINCICAYFEGKKSYESEVVFQTLAGRKITTFTRMVFPMEDSPSQRGLGSVIDMTQDRLRENRLRQTVSELQKSNDRLEEFAYVTSHDLRAPVVNLRSLLGLLDSDQMDDQDQEVIMEKIDTSVAQLESTLHDLIDVVANKKTLSENKQELNFRQITQDVINAVEDQVKATKAQINLDFSMAPLIRYPRPHLKSILMNLITNAIKYRHPDRPPELWVTTRNDEDFTCLVVRDNGLGIDLKHYGENVFKMYKRFHPGTEGKGLGLYLVKTQVEVMGGHIELNSRPGHGSEFRVWLKRF